MVSLVLSSASHSRNKSWFSARIRFKRSHFGQRALENRSNTQLLWLHVEDSLAVLERASFGLFFIRCGHTTLTHHSTLIAGQGLTLAVPKLSDT